MVQGLAFLSKKSWHTKNVANQERVWIEEQKKEAEDSKTKELAKQIQKEREEEDLDRIAGKKSSRLDRGIDWMYQGVKSEASQEDAKKQAEEYLMGKAFTGGVALQPRGDLVQAQDEKEGFNAVVASMAVEKPDGQIASMAEPSVAERNEAFRVKHEDPMFLVSQKRREQVIKVEKKRALYEKVVGKADSDDEDSRKRRKRQKKERKKERKRRDNEARSHRRRSRSRSRSDSESDDNRRRIPEHHRGRKVGTDHHKRRSWHDDDSEEKDQRVRDYNKSRNRDESNRDYDGRQTSRHHDDDSRHTRGYHDAGKSLRTNNFRHNGHEDRKQENRKADPVGDGFGLQEKSKPLNLNDLGPSKELLSRRRQQEAENRQKSKPDRRRMTQEEREQALRAMQADAIRHNENRMADRPVEQEEGRQSASFLHRMAQETHGVRGEYQSMAARVAQNRHTNQRPDESF
jgi:N-terminal domain of CBF1 interacting co-repressor CIR